MVNPSYFNTLGAAIYATVAYFSIYRPIFKNNKKKSRKLIQVQKEIKEAGLNHILTSYIYKAK